MKKPKIINLLEYFSLVLIFSYFFIHSIILVQIGISLALYLININFINSHLNQIYLNIIRKKENNNYLENDKIMKINSNQVKTNKENSTLTLVETIEELGFIPSLDENEDCDAA
tara:strand:+ start:2306 stop:2647 length:342 start_codon:yes stop_codon:yes gene_type:complete